MADFGIRIAKPYYDVRTCADKDLIFNSAWPSLQIVYDGIATSATIAHGLGFPPLAFNYRTLDTSTPYSGERSALSVDSTNVNTTAGRRTVIYNLDISKSVNYGLKRDTSNIGTYDPNYGIRIVKDGNSIDSTDMRDFILHSRCQSPLVYRVMTKDDAVLNGSLYQITYTWAGAPPFLYGFVCNSSGVWSPSPYVNQVYPKLIIRQGSARQDIAPYDIGGSIIVLRDPMFSPAQITASY